MRMVQIQSGCNGSNVGLVMSDMTSEEMEEALIQIDPEDEHSMSVFEKLEEYASEIDKQCTRMYVDEVVVLDVD